MKPQEIWEQQNQTKTNLQNLRNKYLVAIYDGALKHKSFTEIRKELIRITLNKNKTVEITLKKDDSVKIAPKKEKEVEVTGVFLFYFALKIAQKAAKIGNSYKDPDNISDVFIDLMRNAKVFDNSIHTINEDLRKQEDKNKQKYLNDLVGSESIFFIASSHADSASDHKDYQGKVYVDQYWWQKTRSDEVRDYIQKHNIKTLQWVTGKPVYFVTRPNCRHYFVKATVEEVLGNTYKVPHRKVGSRGEIQTPRDRTLEYYEERLKTYRKLYEIKHSKKLRDLIVKTEILVAKWKKQ